MRINGFLDYSALQSYNKVQYQDENGSVVKKSENVIQEQDNNLQTQDVQKNDKEENSAGSQLPNDKFNIDIVVKKDMNTDKKLVGSESRLESLDVKRAISSMQKDRVLKEYQTFVNNPEEDGFVRKLN